MRPVRARRHARQTFDQLPGEIHASVPASLLSHPHVVLDRLTGGESGAWVSGTGARSRDEGDANAASLRTDGGGVFLGANGHVADDGTLGYFTGWGQSSLNGARGFSNGIRADLNVRF